MNKTPIIVRLTPLLLATALALPHGAQAQTPPNGAEKAAAGPTLSDLGRSLRNYFTEEELNLLFEYMRDSVLAAFKGEEVSLPPDLAFKLEVLLARMKREGGHYMDNLMRQLEKDLERNLKQKLKEKMAEPPKTTPALSPPVLYPLVLPQLPLPLPQPAPVQTYPAPPGYAPAPGYLPPGYAPPGYASSPGYPATPPGPAPQAVPPQPPIPPQAPQTPAYQLPQWPLQLLQLLQQPFLQLDP
ncbi:MAG: hypothetical protein FJ209_11240 [Betaproteobacteria bacterium]|nr:hypothetical protein [Betaproteobacteria bacterium]